MAILVDDKISFYHRTKRDRNHKTFIHFHDVHELYYLLGGSTRYFIGNEIFILSPGEFAFVPKGVFHYTDNVSKKEVERILLEFDDDFVGDEYQKYLDVLKEESHIRFPSPDVAKIETLLGKIAEENARGTDESAELQKLYLRELLILISRHHIRSANKTSGESKAVIEDVIKYISHNANADLSLDALSKKYSISPGHLSKEFKKATGVGLCEYINISRISHAEKLLQKKSVSITRVATECGFNDSNYFSAVFKKYKGITPKKYSMQRK